MGFWGFGVLGFWGLVVDGAGESAALVAEKFGFEQIFRQGAAIDWHEGCKLPPAVEVQRPGDQFLAGAAFPQNQNGALRVSHALNHLEHILHLWSVANDLAEMVFFLSCLRRKILAGPRYWRATMPVQPWGPNSPRPPGRKVRKGPSVQSTRRWRIAAK